jgi:hypothetical protein
MLNRCFNKNDHDYYLYGGRGITVCKRWLKFENFYEDMGKEYGERIYKGEKVSLDRKEVNGNYAPGNCRWATDLQQSRNRRNVTKSSDPVLHRRIRKRMANMLAALVKETFRRSKLFHYLGCSVAEFRQYIESLFQPGMTWNNFGQYRIGGVKTRQLDHIIPCSQFDLSKEVDRKHCFNYMNLRPLWGVVHLRRKYEQAR